MFMSLQWINTSAYETMYPIFALAVIFLATKSFGMLARKMGLPQVVGMVVAGLLIGPAFFFTRPGGFHGIIDTDVGPVKEVLETFANLGVIFILFSSGLETDVKQLKKSGAVATVIACFGVLIPLILGFLGAMFFMPGGIGSAQAWSKDYVLNAIFFGMILTATSVGITVETLRELGHLNSKVGQTIVSAAIIDDVIGIIVVSIVTSLKGGSADNPTWLAIVKIALFFVVAIGLGIGLRYFFKWLVKKYPNKRRTSIFAIVVCLLFAYMAEVVFSVASITGAYLAGLMLSGLVDKSGTNESTTINKKIITVGYLLFSPIFFANIGINADFSEFAPAILGVAAVFVILGILGKIVGCAGISRACKFNKRESLQIGCGMIARGEVALAVYGAGRAAGLIADVGGLDPMIPTVLLILISSILCPLFLKMLFKKKNPNDPVSCDQPVKQVNGDQIGEHGREDAMDAITDNRGKADSNAAEPQSTEIASQNHT